MTHTVCGCLACLVLACGLADPTHAQDPVGLDTGPAKPLQLNEQRVEAYQLELLDLAWQAAVAYPINPHIKNRARAEEQVVLGAVAIGKPQLAWDRADRVVNWRRGACYAEIAHYLLENDQTEHVEYFLQEAIRHSKDRLQGWRHDRVKARVAQARILLGQTEQADSLIAEEDLAGEGERLSTEASLARGDEEYDRILKLCDELVASEGYEAILGALSAYADLYDRYYTDAGRRAQLREKMNAAWQPIPAIRRFELLARLTESAIAHKDQDNARSLAEEADELRHGYAWGLDYDLRLRSDMSRLFAELGEEKRAKALLEEALPIFEAGHEKLENFYRGGALRPIAEGYARLGDTERAHQVYARVVELGAVNPNLRPRISDINATCVSMARHGVRPSAELLDRIRGIVDGLGEQ